MSMGTRVWLLVGALFLAMAGAWTVLFYLADEADVQSVPLVTQERR